MTAPAMVITFLGTGSGVPTLERNLACVAVRRQGELFLFDCGEAAQVQYRRAGLGFAPLRAIFISHLHGDHVTGLLGLLMSLQMADRQDPVDVYGPPGVADYVHANQRLLGTGFGYAIRFHEADDARVLLAADDFAIRCRPLEHRRFCLGFRFEEKPRPGRFSLERARELGVPEGPLFGRLHRGEPVEVDGRVVRPEDVVGAARPGRTIVYTGDTRPLAATADIARDADLLIHDATFGEDEADRAAATGHSTAREAASIARQAEARRLCLTHISSRYAENPRDLEKEARDVFRNSVVAYDGYEVEVPYRHDDDAA